MKLLNSQLNKLKSAIKNEIEVALRLSSNMIGDNESNFPHKLLLANRQVENLGIAFANYLSAVSADIKLSKTQLYKRMQSVGFLGRLLGPLLKIGLPLIKNVIKPLAKNVLISLGLTAAALVADVGIYKTILGSDRRHSSSSASHNTTMLTIWNDEMNDVMKIVISLEDSGILLKGVTETVQNEVKELKRWFRSMLLGTLGASLLGNLLVGQGVNRAGKRRGINRAGEGILRAGYGNNKMDF